MHGRRMDKAEQMRFQGMDHTRFVPACSETELGELIGNSMSINVLQRLFTQVLPAAGLAPASQLEDAWASGEAFVRLKQIVGQGFAAGQGKAHDISLAPPPRKIARLI